MSRKVLFTAICVCVLLSLILAGCATPSNQSSAQPAVTEEAVPPMKEAVGSLSVTEDGGQITIKSGNLKWVATYQKKDDGKLQTNNAQVDKYLVDSKTELHLQDNEMKVCDVFGVGVNKDAPLKVEKVTACGFHADGTDEFVVKVYGDKMVVSWTDRYTAEVTKQ